MRSPATLLSAGAARSRRLLPLLPLIVAVVVASGSPRRTEPAAAPPPAMIYTSGCVESVLVFGPTDYTKGSGSWTIYEGDFTPDSVPGWRYVVEVTNGSPALNSCLYSINGQQYIGLSEFGSSTTKVRRTIDVVAGEANYFDVQLAGTSGRKVTVRVWRFRDPSFVVFGPEQYVRPATIAHQLDTFFIASAAKTPYTLRAINGDPGGSNRLTTATLHINGNQVLSSSDLGTGVATITKTVALADTNVLDLYNQSASGSNVKFTFTATDSSPPVIAISQPADSFLTKIAGVKVTGSVTDETPGWVSVAGRPPDATPGSFSDSLPLTYGFHTLAIQATNSACLTTTNSLVVAMDNQPPVLSMWRPVAAETTVTDSILTVQGYRSDLTRTLVTIDEDPVVEGATGTFSFAYPLDFGPNRILIRVVDQLGQLTEVTRFVFRKAASEPAAPDSVVQYALSTTGVTAFLDGVKFLYTGGSPRQTGVVADSILADRAAVLRGRIRGRDFGALPNVTVSVLDHPEFGQTLTREDGRYDLVVRGGQLLTLRFTKTNYLESQRTVQVPALDYALVDDVALIGKTARVTPVQLTSASVARGRFASDANGDRSARLMFRPGTTAKIGATDFSSVKVRATEFTVGGDGPEAMPGLLPPGSAYTYCVDLRLDQADSAGVDAKFSKPVAIYTKNFLHTPVGTPVPAGYYDQKAARWVAIPNGIVLKLIGVSSSGDTARVDSKGNGVADGQPRLDSLGIDASELVQLKAQYAIGDTVWRIAVDHFSTYDFNFNLSAVVSAMSNAAGRAQKPQGLLEDGCTETGSIIECENRVLGERIPLVGTPYSLNYRSYRAPGDKAIRTARIPVTGDSIPAGLRRIIVQLDVAGQRVSEEISSPSINQVVTLPWDGNDAFGRFVQGSVNARVSVGYEYGVGVLAGAGRWSLGKPSASGAPLPDPIGDRQIGRVTWNRRNISLGAASTGSDGLGGWTISPHHTFDPSGDGAVYYGDGSVMLGDRLRPTIRLVAGNDSPNGPVDEGVLATSAMIFPAAIATGPDGSMYIADSKRGAILKVGRDGIMRRIAGKLNSSGTCFSGDGGPATDAVLRSMTSLAVGPDGVIYIASKGKNCGNNLVCRITQDGIIRKVVGGTSAGQGSGDGDSVKRAVIVEPRSLAVGPDGSLFIGDGDAQYMRVWRITADSIFSAYAGTGSAGGDHNNTIGRATDVDLASVDGLAVDADGNLFIAEALNHRIRIVTPDGMLKTFAVGGVDFEPHEVALAPDGSVFALVDRGGDDDPTDRVWRRDPDGNLSVIAGGGFFLTDGTSATGARFHNPTGLAVGSDGAYYVASGNRVTRIGRTLATQSAGELSLASPDGAEVHFFDLAGRHLRTRDALTGAVMHRFAYDADGRLLKIHDANGDSTVITRDGYGDPQAIVGPYGATTDLTLSGGYLRTVTSPADETITLTTTGDGLLTGKEDARGNEHVFDYDSDGRLESDQDPLTYSKVLGAPSYSGITRTNTLTTPENRSTTYSVTTLYDGTLQRKIVGPDNLLRYVSDSTDARQYRWTPDGLTVIDSLTPEPRFAYMAPILRRSREKLPSGKTRVTETSHSYTATTFNPPQAMSQPWVEGVRINGKPDSMRTTFDAANRRLIVTTAEGRVTTTTVDSAGRPLAVKVGGLDTLRMVFDSRGRLTLVQQGARGWRYGYDANGRLMTARDTLGHTTSFEYDAADRITSQRFPDGREVEFGYDDAGNLTGLTPPGRPEHEFVYTAVDLASSYTPPTVTGVSSPATGYEYNKDRQLRKVTRPDGGLVLLHYDAAGRLDSVTTARGRSQLTYSSTRGQLETLGSPDTVTVTYGYDGPLVTSEQWSGAIPGGASRTVSHVYNREFQPSSQTVAGGAAVGFGYDDDGFLTSAGSLAIQRLSSNGLPDSSHVGVIVRSADYDAAGELQNLRYRETGSGQVLFQQSMKRDELGRIEEIAEQSFGVSRTLRYRYDGAGRLYAVKVGNDTVARYFYDTNGNRVSWDNGTLSPADTATALYDDQDRLLRYRDTRYEWTAAGELRRKIETVSGETTEYWYDALGNLNKVEFDNGDTITYAADGAIRRVGRRLNGAWSGGWLYQDGLRVIAELDASGAVLNRYVYGEEAHVPALMVRGGDTYRLVTDHLGSVRGVVKTSDGTVTQRREYDAWGVATTDSNAAFQGLGYAGGPTDPATGLIRFGARDYEPGVGRWTAKDPIGFAASDLSLFQYVTAEPINHFDPTGLRYIPNLVINLDPNAYMSIGDSGPGSSGTLPILPGVLGALPPYRMPGVTPPWWDVDFICTPNGWVKIKYGAIIIGGRVYGGQKPPAGWKPPFKCGTCSD